MPRARRCCAARAPRGQTCRGPALAPPDTPPTAHRLGLLRTPAPHSRPAGCSRGAEGQQGERRAVIGGSGEDGDGTEVRRDGARGRRTSTGSPLRCNRGTAYGERVRPRYMGLRQAGSKPGPKSLSGVSHEHHSAAWGTPAHLKSIAAHPKYRRGRLALPSASLCLEATRASGSLSGWLELGKMAHKRRDAIGDGAATGWSVAAARQPWALHPRVAYSRFTRAPTHSTQQTHRDDRRGGK